jgi:hypothetical protein
MPILKNTKAKLAEARFFLGHLQEQRAAATGGNPRKPDREPFAFYLSAFITAARSVTWVLQDDEKYAAWLAGWEEDRRCKWAEAHGVDIDGLLKLTNSMRVAVAHQDGHVKTRTETEMVPIITPLELHCYQINILRVHALRLAQDKDSGMPLTSSETHYIDGTDQEVVELCEQYVNYLEALLVDFEREHSGTERIP